MIELHRLTHPEHSFFVNPDLIQTVEAHPDTVIVLTNENRVLVAETPQDVVRLVRDFRASVIARAAGIDAS